MACERPRSRAVWRKGRWSVAVVSTPNTPNLRPERCAIRVQACSDRFQWRAAHCWERRCPHRLWRAFLQHRHGNKLTGHTSLDREAEPCPEPIEYRRSQYRMPALRTMGVATVRASFEARSAKNGHVHQRAADAMACERPRSRAVWRRGRRGVAVVSTPNTTDLRPEPPPTSSSPPAAPPCRPAWQRVLRPDGLFVWLRTRRGFWRGLRRGGLWLLLRRQRVFGARRPGRL